MTPNKESLSTVHTPETRYPAHTVGRLQPKGPTIDIFLGGLKSNQQHKH